MFQSGPDPRFVLRPQRLQTLDEGTQLEAHTSEKLRTARCIDESPVLAYSSRVAIGATHLF